MTFKKERLLFLIANMVLYNLVRTIPCIYCIFFIWPQKLKATANKLLSCIIVLGWISSQKKNKPYSAQMVLTDPSSSWTIPVGILVDI